MVQNLVKIFLVLWEQPKVGLLLQNLVKIFLVLWELPKVGLFPQNHTKIYSSSVGFTKSRAFAPKSR